MDLEEAALVAAPAEADLEEAPEEASAVDLAEVDLEAPAVFTVDLAAPIIADRGLVTDIIIARAFLAGDGDPVITDTAVADALAVFWAP